MPKRVCAHAIASVLVLPALNIGIRVLNSLNHLERVVCRSLCVILVLCSNAKEGVYVRFEAILLTLTLKSLDSVATASVTTVSVATSALPGAKSLCRHNH